MSETVVHVTTIEEWKSVLDVLFKQGYEWNSSNQDSQQVRFKNYHYEAFVDGCQQLAVSDNKSIYFYGRNGYKGKTIEYSEFMSQQKEDNKMETYYVTKEQLDLIEELKYETYPAYQILNSGMKYQKIINGLNTDGEKALLRYLGGDETIEFKVKEQLYRLWSFNDADRKVYMRFNLGTPDWTLYEESAFTAQLEEIKKWKTPAWKIEEAAE